MEGGFQADNEETKPLLGDGIEKVSKWSSGPVLRMDGGYSGSGSFWDAVGPVTSAVLCLPVLLAH